MPSNDHPKYYWDSCVMLSYVNAYSDRLPHIEGLMQKSGRDFQIITSVFSIVEVTKAVREQEKHALSAIVQTQIDKLWQLGSPIQLVEFYELIAQRAARLIRSSIPYGWVLKPADALHLATADQLKVKFFHTYDGKLKKFEELTDHKFDICVPIATEPVMALAPPNPAPKEKSEEDH